MADIQWFCDAFRHVHPLGLYAVPAKGNGMPASAASRPSATKNISAHSTPLITIRAHGRAWPDRQV